jgi:CheY-like chemotaxis protein
MGQAITEDAGHGKPVILVVDDEPEIRELATATLTEHGYRVLSAPTADVALTILQSIVPDVLVTDIIMPGTLDGYELVKTTKKLHPSVRVIMASGYGFMLRNAALKQLGRVLRKPYRAAQLIAVVEEALGM